MGHFFAPQRHIVSVSSSCQRQLNGNQARNQSVPNFLSLYRSARKVMPSCAAARVLLWRLSVRACSIALRSISSMKLGSALVADSRGSMRVVLVYGARKGKFQK